MKYYRIKNKSTGLYFTKGFWETVGEIYPRNKILRVIAGNVNNYFPNDTRFRAVPFTDILLEEVEITSVATFDGFSSYEDIKYFDKKKKKNKKPEGTTTIKL